MVIHLAAAETFRYCVRGDYLRWTKLQCVLMYRNLGQIVR